VLVGTLDLHGDDIAWLLAQEHVAQCSDIMHLLLVNLHNHIAGL
jgi:hypothetical protein